MLEKIDYRNFIIFIIIIYFIKWINGLNENSYPFSLKHYWDFDENDKLGKFNNLTIIDKYDNYTGKNYSKRMIISNDNCVRGKCLNLTLPYYINVTEKRNECFLSPDLCLNGHTYCIWVYKNSNNIHYYFGNGALSGLSYGIAIYHDKQYLFIYVADKKNVYSAVISDKIDNEWRNYCWTWKFNQTIIAYINGTYIIPVMLKSYKRIINQTNLNEFFIGGLNQTLNANKFYANSFLDEFMFWDRILDQQQIYQIFLKTQIKGFYIFLVSFFNS